jgi:hypothetical protein
VDERWADAPPVDRYPDDDSWDRDATMVGEHAPRPIDRPDRPARQDLAPWARRRRPAQEPAPTIVAARVGAAPVFVDDSGRRRRIGRLVASSVVVAIAAYTAVIALNLAGVPLVGNVAPPGVDRLARPVGDTPVVTGPSTEVVTLPPPPPSSDGTTPGPADEDDPSAATGSTAAPDPTAPSTTTTAPTPTTTVRGHGPTTTVTAPGTTDPVRGNGGGRPDTPPGQG